MIGLQNTPAEMGTTSQLCIFKTHYRQLPSERITEEPFKFALKTGERNSPDEGGLWVLHKPPFCLQLTRADGSTLWAVEGTSSNTEVHGEVGSRT